MDAETPQPSSTAAALHTARNLGKADTRLIIIGVLLPVFMGSLDQTVLATALPTIGRDFGDIHNLPWLITAYLIAATAMTPLYGKFSDIYGRRFTVLVAVGFYMAGSLVCALAPSMLVLILGRVIHGLGGGGLTSVGMVVLGDLAAPRDRGKYYGYFAATYTTAGACGPALGGLLAEHLHWSVIFWCNLALGVLALTMTNTLLRRLPRLDRPHRLDFIGAILIVAATVAFMLALSLGGARLAWTSPPMLALAATTLALAVLFVLRLKVALEPLIPISILADPVARWAIAANAFGWSSIIGLNIFLPMFLQNVVGLSALEAGLSLMILMVTLNTSAGLSGQLLGRVRRYKVVPLLALVAAIVAVALLAWQARTITPWSFQVLLALVGLGFGPTAPLATVALQNVVVPHQFGIAIATMNFSRSLLGTITIAVFGAIVAGASGAVDPQAASAPAMHDLATGYIRVFLMAAGLLLVALVAVAVLEERPLKTSHS